MNDSFSVRKWSAQSVLEAPDNVCWCSSKPGAKQYIEVCP